MGDTISTYLGMHAPQENELHVSKALRFDLTLAKRRSIALQIKHIVYVEPSPMVSFVGADIAIDAGTAHGGVGLVRVAGQQDERNCIQ